jgi:hypothetical protein
MLKRLFHSRASRDMMYMDNNDEGVTKSVVCENKPEHESDMHMQNHDELKEDNCFHRYNRRGSTWTHIRSDSRVSYNSRANHGVFGVTLVNVQQPGMHWLVDWRAVAYDNRAALLGDSDFAWKFLCGHRRPLDADTVSSIHRSWQAVGRHFQLLYSKYYHELVQSSDQHPMNIRPRSTGYTTPLILCGEFTALLSQALNFVLAMLDIRLIDATTVLLTYSYNTVMKQNAIDAIKKLAATSQPCLVLIRNIEDIAPAETNGNHDGITRFIAKRLDAPGTMILATSNCTGNIDCSVRDLFELFY